MEVAKYTVAEQSLHFLTRRHDGCPSAPISSAAAWAVRDLPLLSDLRWTIPASVLDSFQRLVTDCERASADLAGLTGTSPHDTGIAEATKAWARELRDGRGFVLLSGVPVAEWSLIEARLFMTLLGTQFGILGHQNPQGDLIAEVRNTGAALTNPAARNYVTDREFKPHCDAADLLGLLCIRPAVRGGQTRLTSSVSIFNSLLEARPDLTSRLFEPVLLDLMDEQPPGFEPVVRLTPAAFADGRLSTFYISDYFRSATRHPGVERDALEAELLDAYDRLAVDPRLELRFDLVPGDLLLVNNHLMLHARDAFIDQPGRERLLLRFLVSCSNGIVR
jgi:hypothetical protein